ncbi:endonuclease/exonuclease/phosphatase family protein [Dyadobacter sandarakinus]|uniref:Endonuclease/exonuclease/phosphatase family protein n=1 Tax=Dyadobacter sandarakinus TaxID=2747268 RepID=A0ABX7I6H1_9BACT|nr:endonuclease/exonuclease/phosphatase family protein [Dyadobacter sandarakinus]QRR00576.1 endonuclease/exonuclease/phosphatase family protein [Dyadobacter sandarakinus]
MQAVKTGLEIAGYLIVIISLIPLIRSDYWTFRVFEYPRLQKLILNIIITSAFLMLGMPESRADYLFVGCTILNACYLGYQIFPFTYLAGKRLKKADKIIEQDQICIFSSNVLQDNKNTAGCMDLISKINPDVILLLETDEYWRKGTEGLAGKYPHQVLVPLSNTYGMLLYSRLPLVNPEVRHLVDEEIPSITTQVQLDSGKAVTLYCVHPTPPVPGENRYSTDRDKELLLIAKEVKKDPKPTIVVGDLNDVAWSYTTALFTKMSGLLDPRIGRGFYNTFHAWYPFLRFPLDHVFCSTDFKLVSLKRLASFGSDHFPILIRLQFEAAAQYQQEEPEPTAEEVELAEEKVHKESPE